MPSPCPTTTARVRSGSSSTSCIAAAPSLRIAVIGLGTGTLAAYARTGDSITFYEIDPLVRDIAFDPTYFTYTSDAAARGVIERVELGDARVRLEAIRKDRPGERYDLIVVDAFSSDAIPVHLLTREAFRSTSRCWRRAACSRSTSPIATST